MENNLSNYSTDFVKVELKGKKILKIKYCSFGDFLELKKVVLSNLKIKIDSDFVKKNIDLSFLKELIEPILNLLGNKELDEIMLKLSSLCKLEEEKLTVDFFENPNNRQYYFECMYYVLMENVKVFLPAGVRIN
jgi:hypothetical protein